MSFTDLGVSMIFRLPDISEEQFKGFMISSELPTKILSLIMINRMPIVVGICGGSIMNRSCDSLGNKQHSRPTSFFFARPTLHQRLPCRVGCCANLLTRNMGKIRENVG